MSPHEAPRLSGASILTEVRMTYHAGLNRPRPDRQLQARFFVACDGAVICKASPLTPRQRREIFERDGYRCQYCGCGVTWTRSESRSLLSDTRAGQVDHVVPRARGGQNDPSNLLLACERCNESKGAA